MLTGLLPEGLNRAVCMSSVLFAAPHLLNVLTGIWDPVFTLADTIAAFGIGITFAALRIRAGSIWPLIGIHALIDFCAFLSLGGLDVSVQPPESLTITVSVGVVFVVFGFFLLSNFPQDKHRPAR